MPSAREKWPPQYRPHSFAIGTSSRTLPRLPVSAGTTPQPVPRHVAIDGRSVSVVRERRGRAANEAGYPAAAKRQNPIAQPGFIDEPKELAKRLGRELVQTDRAGRRRTIEPDELRA